MALSKAPELSSSLASVYILLGLQFAVLSSEVEEQAASSAAAPIARMGSTDNLARSIETNFLETGQIHYIGRPSSRSSGQARSTRGTACPGRRPGRRPRRRAQALLDRSRSARRTPRPRA